MSASDSFGCLADIRSTRGIRPRVCVQREREARASATMRAKGIERTRAIDKTPNAARPRLIPQAYTHPLVFSLSSPTTHPPRPLSPSPLLHLFHLLHLRPRLSPLPSPANLPAPLTLRKSPSYPLRASPSPNAPFARKPTHPRSSRYTLLFLFLSSYVPLYLSSALRISSSISFGPPLFVVS